MQGGLGGWGSGCTTMQLYLYTYRAPISDQHALLFLQMMSPTDSGSSVSGPNPLTFCGPDDKPNLLCRNDVFVIIAIAWIWWLNTLCSIRTGTCADNSQTHFIFDSYAEEQDDSFTSSARRGKRYCELKALNVSLQAFKTLRLVDDIVAWPTLRRDQALVLSPSLKTIARSRRETINVSRVWKALWKAFTSCFKVIGYSHTLCVINSQSSVLGWY